MEEALDSLLWASILSKNFITRAAFEPDNVIAQIWALLDLENSASFIAGSNDPSIWIKTVANLPQLSNVLDYALLQRLAYWASEREKIDAWKTIEADSKKSNANNIFLSTDLPNSVLTEYRTNPNGRKNEVKLDIEATWLVIRGIIFQIFLILILNIFF